MSLSDFDYYNLAPVGYVTIEAQGRILEANLTFANLLGAQRNDLPDLPLALFVLPEDQTDFRQQFERLKESGQKNRFTSRLLTTNGIQLWARLDFSAVFISESSTVYHVVVTDVTEQVRLEEALRERIKEITCLSSISALLDAPGLSLEALLEKTVALIPPAWQFPEITAARIFLHENSVQTPNFRTSARSMLKKVFVNGKPVGRIEVCCLAEHWPRNANPFLPEKYPLLVAVAAALGRVIERMGVKDSQLESERLLNLAQVVARIGNYVMDLRTGIWSGSSVLNSIFGIGDDFVKDVSHWAQLIAPEHRQDILARFNDVVQRGLRWDVEYKIIRPADGQLRWLSAQGEFDYDESGAPIRLSGFIQDITTRKKMELYQQRHRQRMELLSQGASMQTVLTALTLDVEDELPGSIAAVMLTDERKKHLFHAASTQLPEFYLQTLDGIEIGPEAGSCGRAAFIKKGVVDEDIRLSPCWTKFRAAAKEVGIIACWSEPILAQDGEVLGALVAYHKKKTIPSIEQQELLIDLSNWAGIALKNLIQQERLRILSLAVEQSPAAVVITDPAGNITYVNRKFTDVSGYEYDEAIGQNPRFLKTDETPKENFSDLWRTIISGGVVERRVCQ